MEANRWIDLAKSGRNGDGPPGDAGNPRFEHLRKACVRLAERSAPIDLRLFPLDAVDLHDGILERLLFGKELASASERTEELAGAIEGDLAKPGAILAICYTQPTLEAWDAPADRAAPDWADAFHVKEKEFFARLFRTYDLTILVGSVGTDPPSDEDLARTAARIRRCAEGLAFRTGNVGTWKERLDELRSDIARMARNARPVLDPVLAAQVLGAEDHDAGSAALNAGHVRFLQVMARLDQFGKRPVAHIVRGIDADVERLGLDVLARFRGGSYGIRKALNDASRAGDADDPPIPIGEAFRSLRAYELFRDCSRWLGDGVYAWARQWRSRPPKAADAPRTFRVLFIDENLAPSEGEDSELLRCVLRIFADLFPDHGFELDVIDHPDGLLPSSEDGRGMGDSLVDLDRFFARQLPQRVRRHGAAPGFKPFADPPAWPSIWLRRYNAIFCEVDFKRRFGGPQVIQKLVFFLDRTADSMVRGTAAPALLVLSHMDHFGHVHQCLNLRAHAFVNKERLYQIPSRLCHAVQDMEGAASQPAGNGDQRFGSHSNFRVLYSLRADRTAHLRNRNRHLLIKGLTQVPPAGPYETDGQDREWIRLLPKADLHCHFGTSIRLETIEALAFNTVGHLFLNDSAARGNPEDLHPQVKTIVEQVCEIALKAALAIRKEAASRLPGAGAALSPAEQYYRAMEATLRPHHGACASVPDYPYDRIVEDIVRSHPPLKEFQVCSLFVMVATVLHYGRAEAVRRVCGEWTYLEEIGEWCEREEQKRDNRPKTEGGPDTGKPAPAARLPEWTEGFVLPAVRQAIAGIKEVADSFATGSSATDEGIDRYDLLRRCLSADADSDACATFWKIWRGNVEMRVEKALDTVMPRLTMAATRLGLSDLDVDHRVEGAPSLEEMVTLPEQPEAKDHRLLRYLWGCGLLGAAHFQYPENIALAAHDLVRQNAEDCVVYTEARCETPGYTRAGMSAESVTTLLCLSLDMAAAFEREVRGRPFVRTNLLLAAKRHKAPEHVEPVVSLLINFLGRPRRRRPIPSLLEVPAWWRPASPVGFDLSGDESQNPDALTREISRLFSHSSPITIHAGEAASAESIWRAVYQYHARRIGHGLRLRERSELLRFCINEGICMEMCPISNRFTFGFNLVGDAGEYEPRWLEHYPLRYFMDVGLDVCVNTDNRSIHGQKNRTLTDEYLWAARLSGGLTRWEVLKLVKAGFKHAFIDKRDVQDLIQAVEDRTFSLTATASGLNWHP